MAAFAQVRIDRCNKYSIVLYTIVDAKMSLFILHKVYIMHSANSFSLVKIQPGHNCRAILLLHLS